MNQLDFKDRLLTVETFNLIKGLGFTVNQVQHCIDTQVPELFTEACKRIRYAPFDLEGMYVGHSGGKDSVLVRYLADQALSQEAPLLTVHTPKEAGVKNAVHPMTREFMYGLNRPVLYIADDANLQANFERFGLKTQIDGTRAAEASRRDGRDVGVVVRGEARSRADMPMYLEDGLFGLQFIYPIFDWTDLQVWSAIFCYAIPFSEEYFHVNQG